MGQKVPPKATRLGYIQDWDSRWFPLRNAPALIVEDAMIRRVVAERFKHASISKVVIERAGSFLRVILHTARPGMVIGRRGADIESFKSLLEERTGRKTFVNVLEIKYPELDAALVAESIAFQLERRVNHRRAVKRAIERGMAQGASGIKVMVSGRLGGAEIARFEWHKEGRVPTSTFRADVTYGTAEAFTVSGKIGVKVWIFKKEYFTKSKEDLVNEIKKAKAQETGMTQEEGIPMVALGSPTAAPKPTPVPEAQSPSSSSKAEGNPGT
ncbi:MAG: 30S ribosomal protein S3 [Elusimicrobia bacterium]|nr:30S ribosomal protein S3 [Elusimicrobiota bacterium]